MLDRHDALVVHEVSFIEVASPRRVTASRDLRTAPREPAIAPKRSARQCCRWHREVRQTSHRDIELRGAEHRVGSPSTRPSVSAPSPGRARFSCRRRQGPGGRLRKRVSPTWTHVPNGSHEWRLFAGRELRPPLGTCDHRQVRSAPARSRHLGWVMLSPVGSMTRRPRRRVLHVMRWWC